MRIVFMGASELGWECCKTLFDAGQQVVGIFSIPQEFKISWSDKPVTNVRYRSFTDLAREHGVPLIQVTKKMSDPEYREILLGLRPDILIVIGWYYIVPRALRAIAPLGAAGIHASLLPRNRGGAPLVWAMINGEIRTGVTFFYFEDGVDDGDIIAQSEFDIASDDTIAEVIQKSSAASVRIMREFVPLLAAGTAPRLKQDHSLANILPQRKPEDGLLKWDARSAVQAYDWVRAQTRPYPGAFTCLGTTRVTLWKASLTGQADDRQAFQPGEIRIGAPGAKDELGVWCADHRLLLLHEVEVNSGSEPPMLMSASQFAEMLKKHTTQTGRFARFTNAFDIQYHPDRKR